MNRCKPLLLLLILCLFSVVTHAQTDSLQSSADSLRRSVLDPYASGRQADSYGTYVATVSDPILFHTYAGLSAFNVLRGNIPPFYLNASVPSVTTAAFRGASYGSSGSMILVDGVPIGSDGANIYNLNAFEYENVSVVGNGNTVYPFGGIALPSGFSLRSKSGEGRDKPSVEVNSYTTVNIAEDGDNVFGKMKDRWAMSQSLAYAQDFGTFDLRASANYRTSPIPESENNSGKDRTIGFRLNGGASLKKFSVRFIGDYRTNDVESTSVGWSMSTTTKAGNAVLQGNLYLQYQFTDWLKLSSQQIFTGIDTNRDYVDISKTEMNQNRRMHNLIVSTDKHFSAAVTLRGFAGVQLEHYTVDQEMYAEFYFQSQKSELNNLAIVGGAGSTIGGVWDIDANLRSETFSLFPSDVPVLTYTVSTAFHPTRLWESAPGQLKIRGSFTSSDNNFTYDYPVNPEPSEEPMPLTARKSIDAGFDLSLFRNRFTASFSYYKVLDESIYVRLSGPLPFPEPYIELGELHNSGVEVATAIRSVATKKWLVDTRLGFNRYDVKIKSDQDNRGTDNPPLPGDAYPDWTGTLLNQVRFSGFFLNFMIDVLKGGRYMYLDRTNGTLHIVEINTTRFRDISLGYSLPEDFRNRIGLGPSHISISGRNLVWLDDKDREPSETGSVNPYVKSVSVSLTISI